MPVYLHGMGACKHVGDDTADHAGPVGSYRVARADRDRLVSLSRQQFTLPSGRTGWDAVQLCQRHATELKAEPIA
ncbi:MAG: hypothetical protein ABIZ34_06270 [Candidatus Limnocylindrales bacterium]